MKNKLIRKYLAPSPATPKGRMKRLRTGVRSTRHKGQSLQQNDSEATNKSDKTGLWHLPVNPSEPPDYENITGVTNKISNSSVKYGAANSVYTLPYNQQQVKYMHQVFVAHQLLHWKKQ